MGNSCVPLLSGMRMEGGGKAKREDPAMLDGEEHEYVREFCQKPLESLKTFNELVDNEKVLSFASSYEPETRGAVRAVSGLLLFGPSGTGKSASAEAVASFLGGSYYTFSGSDLPNGTKGAKKIDA